jgi:auxin efflux carrier (AEC)
MIDILANSLVPVFVVLALGFGAGRRRIVDNQHVRGLVGFLMNFALPCSLFVTIARTPPALLEKQWKAALVLSLVYLVLFALTYYASRHFGRESPAGSAVLALTLGFPNTAGIGFPLLLAVYGAESSVTVAVAIAVGSITITPLTLAILESGTEAERNLSRAARIRGSIVGALIKPVFWAPVLGVVVSLVQFHLPTYFNTSLSILGGATEGTALFVTGLILSVQHFRFTWEVGGSVMAKNFLQPALCGGAAILLGLPWEQTKYVVLLSAIPGGFFGVLFGEGFDVTPELASSALVATTVVGVITLAGWIVFLGRY